MIRVSLCGNRLILVQPDEVFVKVVLVERLKPDDFACGVNIGVTHGGKARPRSEKTGDDKPQDALCGVGISKSLCEAELDGFNFSVRAFGNIRDGSVLNLALSFFCILCFIFTSVNISYNYAFVFFKTKKN